VDIKKKSLISPEAKEGRAVLGMRWIGWLTDLRDST